VKKPKKPEAPVPCDPKDLLDELETLTSAKMSEVRDMALTPDAEMSALITDVISAAAEFRPLHQKLTTLIEAHRTKIILLKSKFDVRAGMRGNPVMVGKSAMYWEDFVIHYFDVTPHRLNQLLNAKDDKDEKGTVVRTPDEEKPLFKKGLSAGERKYEGAKKKYEDDLRETTRRLTHLEVTPEARELAQKVFTLEMSIKKRDAELAKRGFSGSATLPKLPKPTLDDWQKHRKSPPGYPRSSFKHKYFAEAANYFWNRYENVVESGTFKKALEHVGSPKHGDDLTRLAAMLQSASENLRILAEAVKPKQADAVSGKSESSKEEL